MSDIVDMKSNSNVVRGAFREGFVARIVRRIKDWSNRRQAVRQLNMMSDSLLRDIGIERYQISDVVNQRGVYAKLNVARAESVVASAEIKEAA